MATKSIITDNWEECYLCGRLPCDTHHCLHGTANRALADKYKLVVPLCRECHARLHDKGVGDFSLKMAAQMAFEKHVGDRLQFIDIFGVNYL